MSLSAKKSLGQHWLEDRQILNSICEIAEVIENDNVLEIGPGHGSLTEILIQKGAKVVAVELDTQLASTLKAKFPSQNLKVLNSDILEFDLNSLPSDYKVVANIPYYLTSNLIRVLCESANPAKSITLLVQREVAERICAKPGAMSILSVSAQVYYECELGLVVSRDKFNPPPKVDSQVVNMKIRSQPMIEDIENKHFFRVVKAGFSNRRKTLHNSLSAGLHIPKQEIATILGNLGISQNSRAQELSIEKWIELAKYLTR